MGGTPAGPLWVGVVSAQWTAWRRRFEVFGGRGLRSVGGSPAMAAVAAMPQWMGVPLVGGRGSSMAALKQALRTELKRRLRALSPGEKARQSKALSRRLLSHHKYQESERVAVFLSMPDEVQTEEIIRDLFRRGKDCFIPRYHPQSNHMDMVKLASVEEITCLPLTPWNIAQPAEDDTREEALSTEGLDLILMPGLGFDPRGQRLGRGKGYYDTYLERCMRHPKGKPYTIALAFKEQICNSVPVSDHDIAVDEVLYESEDPSPEAE